MSLNAIGGGGSSVEFNPNVFPTGNKNGENTLFKLLPGKPIAMNSDGRPMISGGRISGLSLTDGADYIAFNYPEYEGGPMMGYVSMIKIPQEDDLNFAFDYYSPN